MKRAPNTEYILSLSYGKDSLACLEAIRQLGYPLDRIIHAEVWATDTIPADLPPMVEFKKYADQVIFDRYGVVVEHIYATRAVERERERESYERLFYSKFTSGRNSGRIYGFPFTIGAWCNDRLKVAALELIGRKNNIRENVLPYSEKEDKECREREREFGQDDITGFPVQHFPWCNSGLKLSALRISNINRKRELVHRTQTTSFQIAPLHRGQK